MSKRNRKPWTSLDMGSSQFGGHSPEWSFWVPFVVMWLTAIGLLWWGLR